MVACYISLTILERVVVDEQRESDSRMNILDMRTVIVIGVVTDVICTFVIADLWRLNRKRIAGMVFWFCDFLCQTLGLLLIALRGDVPDWLSIIVANTLIIAGAMLGYLGFERFVDKRSPQTGNALLLAAFVGLQTFLTYGYPSLSGRSLNVAVALLCVCAQCAWLLLSRADAEMRQLTRWLGVLFASYCLIFGLRTVLFFCFPCEAADYYQGSRWESFFHIVFQAHIILLMYGLVLDVNKRLLMDIQLQEEKYAKVFHSSPYGIILTRLSDGKLLESNESFINAVGFAREELVGRTTLDLNIWAHVEDRVAMIAELAERGSVKGKEFEFKKKSGEILTGLYSAEIITIHNEKYILSSIHDVSQRKRAEADREKLLAEREKVLSEMKVLSGLLPICASCKKIRDDRGYWNQIEVYIRKNSEADFSHSLCPECSRKLYPELVHDAAVR